jgi:hypothetical protein
MALTSWLAAMIPGVDREPLKKILRSSPGTLVAEHQRLSPRPQGASSPDEDEMKAVANHRADLEAIEEFGFARRGGHSDRRGASTGP